MMGAVGFAVCSCTDLQMLCFGFVCFVGVGVCDFLAS